MNLSELLQAKELEDIRVLNGKANLERVISSVESSETPDIADYLSPNALLITTAMAFKDNQEGLCHLIRELSALPCAGMAIKLGRFIDYLENQVVETADACGFPLLQIPMYLTLGEVYHRMLALLWNNENENLVYALNMQRQFYNLIHQGAALGKLANNLGMILKVPIFILDLFGEMCASCNATRQQEKMAVDIFLKHGHKERNIGKFDTVFSMDGALSISAYPITVANYNTHYLVMMTREETLTHVSEFVLEQILLIFSVYFYKSLYRDYHEIRMRENYLRQLIDPDPEESVSEKKMISEGTKFGIRNYGSYTVIVGKLRGLEGKVFNSIRFMRREEQYILIYDLLKKRLEKESGRDILIFPDTGSWSYVILVQRSTAKLDEHLTRIHEELKRVIDVHLEFTYGNLVNYFSHIQGSWRKAMDGFQQGLPQDESLPVRQYRPLNILDHLKYLSKEYIDIEELCLRTLHGLSDPGDAAAAELKKTLRAYLNAQCSITDTASTLFLHRNTVRNRIRQCEKILNGDLNDPDFRLQVQLSLMFMDA